MHLKEILLRFNISHFIFYCILLLFAILIGLRADGVLTGPYSAVFLPLWIWNGLVLVGGVMGVVRWFSSSRDFREEDEHVYQFKAMLTSAILQVPIFITELLISINIDTGSMPWSAVFAPLYLLWFLSIPSCIWGCYRKRSVEIELLSIMTLLQLVFFGIRLDQAVHWRWAIVFVPTWLLLCGLVIGLIIMGVVTILSYILGENQQDLEQRKLPDIIFFVFASAFAIFIIIFMGLLSSRLDENITSPYSAILIPLYLSLFSLIAMTLGRKPANIWWFGVKKNFVDFVLEWCPLLQDYANVSYTKVNNDVLRKSEEGQNKKDIKPVQPVVITSDDDIYQYENIYEPD